VDMMWMLLIFNKDNFDPVLKEIVKKPSYKVKDYQGGMKKADHLPCYAV